ncbi:MAG: acyl-CoA dehydrogenase [Marmoricola sp.]|nr:acyl-CoA dehydrogenase [Marmoricola sp.]
MDLALTRTQVAFRNEVRTWLSENVPAETFASPGTAEGLAQHRAWERQLYGAGLAAVHWPSAFGGRGMGPVETSIFYDEYLAARAPDRLNRLALGLAGPTLIECGTPDQRGRWLANMLSCDEIWCQGFSEPDAGSDLASLRTRGVIDGDVIRVTGQKIWTSHSKFADWIFALVRTDPDAAKHRGITFLMIDRHSPGVEIKPITQMNHAAEFGELFFNDVEVPLHNVIGEINEGWRTAMITLTHERGSNLNTSAHFHRLLQEVVEMIPDRMRSDPRVQLQVGRFHEEIEAYRYLTLRTLTELSKGRPLGPQSGMGKLWWSEMQTRIHEFGLSLLGPRAEVLSEDGVGSSFFQRYWLGRAAHIYAGSNEIQRNIIAERTLGLPKGR